MNSKQRFLKAINMEEPDRVPILANLTSQVAEKVGSLYGLPYEPHEAYLSDRVSFTEILLHLGNDAVMIGPGRDQNRPTRVLEDGTTEDEWGIVRKMVGFYCETVKKPLENANTVEDINNYRMPDPLAQGRWDLAEKAVAKYAGEYGIVGNLEVTLFELANDLMGMEKLMMDLATGEDYVISLFDRIIDYQNECGKKMIDMGADMILTGDDVGTQRGMLISPEMWREIFKPRMKKLYDSLRSFNPEVKIAYHSCGSIVPIIEDLIEIGVDFLNPIQPMAEGMVLEMFKKKYGDRLGFFGGVDVQHVLPSGSVNDVIEEVKLRIRSAGHGGGFIIAPTHNIQPDTPVQNVIAFFEAVKENGKYPIKV
jgi:uroporphyrinogen decarboxylase